MARAPSIPATKSRTSSGQPDATDLAPSSAYWLAAMIRSPMMTRRHSRPISLGAAITTWVAGSYRDGDRAEANDSRWMQRPTNSLWAPLGRAKTSSPPPKTENSQSPCRIASTPGMIT